MVLARIRAGQADHPLRDRPAAQGRHADSDFADGLADSTTTPAASSARRKLRAISATRRRPPSPAGGSPPSSNRPTTPSSRKDLNSIITSWNAAAERMFGYTADEAIGQSIRMLIPEELQDEEDMVLAKIRAGEKIDHFETIRQRKDGTRLIISLTVSPHPERARRDRRRLEGRARHHRAVAAHGGGARTRREHREARRGRRRRRLDARSRGDRPESHRHRDGADAREFGAFFYNVTDPESGDAYMLYTLSGAPREAFAKFPASARDGGVRADVPRRRARCGWTM